MLMLMMMMMAPGSGGAYDYNNKTRRDPAEDFSGYDAYIYEQIKLIENIYSEQERQK